MDGMFLAVAWYVPLLMKFLFGNILTPVFTRKLSQGTYLPQKLAVQFLFCSVLALATALYIGNLTFDVNMMVISIVGFANAWAAYASWRAMAINMSKMSLFVLLNPGLSMALSVVFLGESQHLSTALVAGILLNLGAMFLMGRADFLVTKKDGQEKTVEDRQKNREFYLAVLTYSFIWGMANFFVKYWSLNNVPVGTYISGWYAGSLIGALSIVYAVSRNSQSKELFGKNQLTRADLIRLIFVSVTILASLASIYWSHFLAPQLVVFPLLILGDKIGPILVGFLFFGERKKFSTQELVYLVVGVVGGVLIAFSLYS
jgi:hypothetical protein